MNIIVKMLERGVAISFMHILKNLIGISTGSQIQVHPYINPYEYNDDDTTPYTHRPMSMKGSAYSNRDFQCILPGESTIGPLKWPKELEKSHSTKTNILTP